MDTLFVRFRFRGKSVFYRSKRARKWRRVRNASRNVKIRVKGSYKRVRPFGNRLGVRYRGRTRPIRVDHGKVRFYKDLRWRRTSTSHGRRSRKRREEKGLMKRWARFVRRRIKQRRRYGLRNGRVLFKYGGKFRKVLRKTGRLRFHVGHKVFGLR